MNRFLNYSNFPNNVLKPAIIAALLLVFFQSQGQKNTNQFQKSFKDEDFGKSYYHFNQSIISLHQQNVKNYLLKNFPHLDRAGSTIICESSIESPGAWHFTFIQEFKGNEIYGSQIKIGINKKGKILSIFDNSFTIHTALPEVFPPKEVLDSLFSFRAAIEYRINQVYFPLGSTFIAALKLQLADEQGNVMEFIVDEFGKIIYSKDLNMYMYHRSQDSVVMAGVFLPNPLISAAVTYAPPYIDDNNSDIAQLNAEIIHTTMKVKYDAGTFTLESPWAKITEHSSPVTSIASNTIPEFIYTRSQSEFEDVNAYYHINEYQKYIQSLGFTNLANYQIHIDAHALNGADQSSFSPFFTVPQLNFGEGGVDDAEDAHVIIHEYGHAIMHSAAPNTNNGNERQALDEAIGDYFAVSYSKAINPFDWQKVFSWDGHNSFWNGRNAASTKIYPQDLSGSYHLNGEIWSSVLMQINNAIGRELTDQILLQSAYSYASNMKMPDAAILFLQANELLNQGENFNLICNFFNQRGLYICNTDNIEKVNINPLSVEILNSDGFAKGIADATIRFPFSLDAKMEIFDSTGKIIRSIKISNSTSITLSSKDYNQGIYFLKFQSNYTIPVIKLIKFQH
ncbi:MAG: T9SS type A sorting domain-containing protein [Bacteroidetes bacterium]|nr:T9SS type A sorting domain-containing protein [Bacteroidota bacterium]HET6243032.1 T9SS type A sorting domain-containing protein [Bacteroidia bacterium]